MKNIFLRLSTALFPALLTFSLHAQSWSLTGNGNIKPSTNFLGTTNNKAVIFRANNIERMRINSNGKVGIGTKTPDALLTIANSSLASLSSPGAFIIGMQAATNLAFDYHGMQARYNGQGGTLFLNQLAGPVWVGSNGKGFPALWTNADGRVGIATNYALAAGYALTVEPSLAGNGIYINDPGNGYSLYTIKTGNYGAAIHVQAPYTYIAAIEAFTHNAQRAIYGEDSLNGNGVEGRSYGGNAVVGVSAVNVGILGIAPTYAGYFDGDVYASGVYSGSDQKLKQNISDLSNAMAIIDQLHPRHYEYRHDNDYKWLNLPNGEHYGLIAQDVEKILPALVKDTKFETRLAKGDTSNSATVSFKALNYTELIPVIIKGMQEQQQTINSLQEVNKKQQQQIDELRQMIHASIANKAANSSSVVSTSASLLQNAPNPFSQNTVISCYVPSSAKQAQLIINNADGRILKSYSLVKGRNTITINANTLAAGEYMYSLLIDGKEIDSRRMTLTK